MQYSELPLPPALEGLVAAIWTVSVESEGWVEHEAVPDGCVELIRRHAGRSVWREAQPELFATGLAHAPARLRFSGDARFTGVKLWPWAWHALGGTLCPAFANDWIAVEGPLAALLPPEGDVAANLVERLADIAVPPLAAAILAATGVADITRRTGLSHRQLQRIFARDFGMPPRAYLRLLRFRGALIDVQENPGALAATAADQGYADQAHMARDFKSLAGIPPRELRARAKGPFV